MKFYSIYDKELEKYSVPFVAENDLIAERQFFTILDKYPDTVISQLNLVSVGSFFEESGLLEAEDLKEICAGDGIVDWRKLHAFKDKVSK